MNCKTGFVFLTFTSVLNFLTVNSQCDVPYQCSNQTISPGSGDVAVNGYKSAFGPGTNLISSGFSVYPRSAYGAQYSSLLEASHILCNGVAACSQVSSIVMNSLGTGIQCLGTSSCANSELFSKSPYSDVYVYCAGEQSCFNTSINGFIHVWGLSSLSLVNSVVTPNISSSGQDNMNVYLTGFYAGYNTTVLCENVTTCSIYCYGNGCYNTYYDCNTNTTTCNIKCSKVYSMYCPQSLNLDRKTETDDSKTGTGDVYNDTSILEDFIDDLNLGDSRLTLLGEKIIKNEDKCNRDEATTVDIYPTNLTFNFDISDTLNSNKNGSICFRAYSMPQGTISLYNKDNDIICGAVESCNYNTLNITNDNGNVFCHAYNSCPYSTMYGDGAGGSGGIVDCAATTSCYDTNIFNFKKVFCSAIGFSGTCESAQLYGVSNVYALAGSLYGSNFTASAYTMRYAKIYSNDVGVMNVYFMAYDASRDVDIYCTDNEDVCNVYCLTTRACGSKLNIYCTNGQCNIYCDVSIGIDCTSVNINITGSSNVNVFTNLSAIVATNTDNPTVIPTSVPTNMPTGSTTVPTIIPTSDPTTLPTDLPTHVPSLDPTQKPTLPLPNTTIPIITTDIDLHTTPYNESQTVQLQTQTTNTFLHNNNTNINTNTNNSEYTLYSSTNNGNNQGSKRSDKFFDQTTIIYIVIGAIGMFLLVFLILVCFRKYASHRKHQSRIQAIMGNQNARQNTLDPNRISSKNNITPFSPTDTDNGGPLQLPAQQNQLDTALPGSNGENGDHDGIDDISGERHMTVELAEAGSTDLQMSGDEHRHVEGLNKDEHVQFQSESGSESERSTGTASGSSEMYSEEENEDMYNTPKMAGDGVKTENGIDDGMYDKGDDEIESKGRTKQKRRKRRKRKKKRKVTGKGKKKKNTEGMDDETRETGNKDGDRCD